MWSTRRRTTRMYWVPCSNEYIGIISSRYLERCETQKLVLISVEFELVTSCEKGSFTKRPPSRLSSLFHGILILKLQNIKSRLCSRVEDVKYKCSGAFRRHSSTLYWHQFSIPTVMRGRCAGLGSLCSVICISCEYWPLITQHNKIETLWMNMKKL